MATEQIPSEDHEQMLLVQWFRRTYAGVRIFAEKRVAILENYGPITVTIFEDPDGVLVELVSLPTREQIKAFRAAAAGNPGA